MNFKFRLRNVGVDCSNGGQDLAESSFIRLIDSATDALSHTHDVLSVDTLGLQKRINAIQSWIMLVSPDSVSVQILLPYWLCAAMSAYSWFTTQFCSGPDPDHFHGELEAETTPVTENAFAYTWYAYHFVSELESVMSWRANNNINKQPLPNVSHHRLSRFSVCWITHCSARSD